MVVAVNEFAWTQENVRDAIEKNSFSYQNVPLPFGLETGGKDRSETARSIFPDDLKSKSVLDVGCMYGYFCFAAEDRGAINCLGVDIDRENVRKSSLLAAIRGSSATFRHLDIEADAIPGSFDYVLCLNVLHHLRNPIASIDKLAAATRDTLVLEIASFSRRDRKKNGVSWLIGKLLGWYPIFFVAGDSSQTFFMTAAAVRRLLLKHRFDFARAEKIADGHKGRFIIVAKRRRIDRLVIVAGLPASGKSTFIDYLSGPSGADLSRQIGADPDLVWAQWLFGKLLRSEHQDLGNVILHYNISKHLIDGDLYHHSRALSDLINVSREVAVVTVNCPRTELLERFRANRMNNTRKSLTSRRHRKKIDQLKAVYERPESLKALYDDWFGFLDKRNIRHVTVAAQGSGYAIQEAEMVEDSAQARK